MNVPIGAAIGMGAWVATNESRDPHAKRIDLAGSTSFAEALACAVSALISIPLHGWNSAPAIGLFAASAELMFVFICVERWQARPMIVLALFTQRRFVGSLLGMFGYAACAQVMMTFLPLFQQIAFGFSALRAGFAMLPFAIAMIAGPQVSVLLLRRMNTGGVLAVGLVLIGMGNLSTALFAVDESYILVVIPMIVAGIGAGLMNGDTQKRLWRASRPGGRAWHQGSALRRGSLQS